MERAWGGLGVDKCPLLRREGWLRVNVPSQRGTLAHLRR